MGVCNSAHKLAQAIRESGLPLDSLQELQIEILKLGPLYLKICNLPMWESAFQNILPDEDDVSEVGLLINDIYELAMLNMYGQFGVKRTKEFAKLVVEAFNKSNVLITIDQLELEDW